MLVSTSELLHQARKGRYSIGAFNIYNLEEMHGVIAAAETLHSPVILQVLPKALDLAGTGLINLCLEVGHQCRVPVSVHLDHCTCENVIAEALSAGISSVMADGSHLSYEANVAFTRNMVQLAGESGALVEAELGQLTGTEDGLTVAQYESRLTDPRQAEDFVARTRVAALAVCIGNVHGPYPNAPQLDYQRLEEIAARLTVPLVLHGTSGLPDSMIRRVIERGVCKFNVNTELREAYLHATRQYMNADEQPELVALMQAVIKAVGQPVKQKMALFGSAGKAAP